MDLRDKTALVTGASKRVGREIALALAKRGANIVVHYNSSAAEARAAVTEIQSLGVDALAVAADQTDGDAVRAAVARAMERFGDIHVLVASAAVYKKTPFETLNEDDWDFHIDANLKGPFLFSLEIGKRMKARKLAGKIVLFADWAAIRPYADYLPYCVSKAGVICLTRSLAKALAPTVQVNAIAPGPVLLPPDFSPEETRQVAEATLVKHIGSPQDIVQSVLFLVEGSDFVTGHTLVVDGGRLIAGG